MLRAALLVTMLLTPCVAFADGPSAQEIIDKALDNDTTGFQSGKAQLTLTIQDKGGAKRERSLEVKSKRTDGKSTSLVTLTAPAQVKGQAFLFAEKEGDDDVWMYLPAFKVTRRIEGKQKNGAFLGSHFTYSDLETRDLEDATYEKQPDDKIAKDDVYVIAATPKPDANSDYTKIVTYIRKTDFVLLKSKFFGKGNKLKKTLFVEKLDKTSAGRTYASQTTLSTAEGGFTTIAVTGLETDVEIPDSVFSREQLGK
jgi:hypothetical protein